MTGAWMAWMGAAGVLATWGCDTEVVGREDAAGGSGNVGGTGGGGGSEWPIVLPTVDKVDLLLAIDNSRSMADKQEILSYAVPELITGLAALNPEISIHIGVVTSSLGDYGTGTSCAVTAEPTNNDRGRLVARALDGSPVPTYQNLGFIAWDPAQVLTPPGEDDQAVLTERLTDLVRGANQAGCGFEAPLESWYRFLVEPDPYDQIAIVEERMDLQGTDQVILDQRASFVRPDSMVLVLQLTDENDCSIRTAQDEQGHIVALNNPGAFQMPRARTVCQTNPNDPCCVSCVQPIPDGCSQAPDPACDSLGWYLTPEEDPINLRCWDQKRRFGLDFLFPVERYIDGLAQPTVVDRFGNTQTNPIYASGLRDPGLVVFATVTGVPWQDIARKNDNGVPDLLSGLNQASEALGGFMTGEELVDNNVWPLLVGDPSNNVPPSDPLMIESVAPRTGTHPITGEVLGTTPGSSSINGNEKLNTNADDLQYTCILPLPTAVDCSAPGEVCDCDGTVDANNPLCEPNPADSGELTLQVNAKAYPGRRQLLVAKGAGESALVGSICAAQVEDPDDVDYAYRPAIRSIIENISPRITKP